jgi:hypothetical protein
MINTTDRTIINNTTDGSNSNLVNLYSPVQVKRSIFNDRHDTTTTTTSSTTTTTSTTTTNDDNNNKLKVNPNFLKYDQEVSTPTLRQRMKMKGIYISNYHHYDDHHHHHYHHYYRDY